MQFKKTRLDNGLRIVTEEHPWSNSIHIGFFIESGTKHELEGQMGMAHLTEHMVFKGTKTQSPLEIVVNIEKLGGEINAHTSRDYTCYTVQTLANGFNSGLKSLFDLAFEATFPEDEFAREVDVVKQEIDMSKDLLEDYIFDLYFERAYPDHPISRNILGTTESLAKITHQDLKKYYNQSYQNERMILAVSGAINHEQVLEALKKQGLDKLVKDSNNSDYKNQALPSLNHQSFYEWIFKPTEQTHMLVGLPSVAFTDDFRFESYILSSALGGGMTSKLYQIIREDKGWAYSIYTYLQSFIEGGSLAIYLGTAPQNVIASAQIINEQLKLIKEQKGLSQEDLDLYKTQVESGILMGADDLDSRMNSIGINEMVFGQYRSVEEVVNDIRKVSLESMQNYVKNHLDASQAGLLVVGEGSREQMAQAQKFRFDF